MVNVALEGYVNNAIRPVEPTWTLESHKLLTIATTYRITSLLLQDVLPRQSRWKRMFAVLRETCQSTAQGWLVY